MSLTGSPSSSPIPTWKSVSAVLLTLAIAISIDVQTWTQLPVDDRSLGVALFLLVSPPSLTWLAAFPIFYCLSRRIGAPADRELTTFRAVRCFFICTVAGAGTAAFFGWPYRELPPLYHDEYSYLFQAKTFLAGRTSFPTPELASAFQQMHVLTEPVWASRYFPGMGAWLAPFVAVAWPLLGSWTCSGLTAGFTALAGRRLNPLTGYLAGLWMALAPVNILLGNLLLSSGPTMLAFALFLWAYFSMFDEPGRRRWPLLAGCAIGMAFLIRPLTAVGLGFPFALYSLWQCRRLGGKLKWLIAAFVPWAAMLAVYNASITGSIATTPYGLYTERHTPAHVYGFYNVDRALSRRGPETLTGYDEWAENLTPGRSVRLTADRWLGMIAWTTGFTPALLLGTILIATAPRWGDRRLLLFLAVLGLSSAYFPYAFPGVFGWGYLIEATPAWLLLLASALSALVGDAAVRQRLSIGIWWLGLFVLSVGQQLLLTTPTVFDRSSEFVHPRLQANFQMDLELAAARSGPIVVLVDAKASDHLHSTLVHNDPSLGAQIIRLWNVDGAMPFVARRFPERDVYLFRPANAGRPPEMRLVRPAARRSPANSPRSAGDNS